jgi:hypothetical protein
MSLLDNWNDDDNDDYDVDDNNAPSASDAVNKCYICC